MHIKNLNISTDHQSEELQDIVTSPPGRMLRYGNIALFVFILFILVISWIIKYPDIVYGRVKIYSLVTPKLILPRAEGRIVKLLINDGGLVKKGQVIMAIESSANYQLVLDLEKDLDRLVQSLSKTPSGNLIHFSNYSDIGELQNTFAGFYQQYKILEYFLTHGNSAKSRAMIERDIANYEAISKHLLEQKGNTLKELKNIEEEYLVYQKLEKEKVIAPLDLKKYESAYLNKKNAVENIESAILSNRSIIFQKEKELTQLDKELLEQWVIFNQQVSKLHSEIITWKNNYLAIAPIDGIVRFSLPLEENQMFSKESKAIYVVDKNENFIGEMSVSQENFGKLKKGNIVNINLSSYPSGEYGLLQGNVSYISEISNDNGNEFSLRISFPPKIVTTYGKEIVLKNGMVGDGQIQTNDIRLIEKIFYQFRRVMQNTRDRNNEIQE